MSIAPRIDHFRDLQACFECNEDRDTALAEFGLTGDRFAIDTWNRWQREMDKCGFYNFVEKPITKHRVAVQEHYTFTLTTYIEVDASDTDQAAELVEEQYNKQGRSYWNSKDWSKGAEWFDNVTFETDPCSR